MTCARDGSGLSAVRASLGRGRTIALLGSSGVGKSTLVNGLLGMERQATAAVREADDRGRHTTTSRELVALPGGGLVIDTPGLREVQLWLDEDALAAGFADVEAAAQRCRFRDCRHEGEPGCAVAEALASGSLDPGRLESYRKLQRELQLLETRASEHGKREQRRRDRRLGRLYRKIKEDKRRRT